MARVLVSVLLGMLSWTLIEYLMHRFVGHVFRVETPFRREHLRHHRERLYFAGPLDKAKMAVAVSVVLAVVAVPAAGPLLGGTFVASVVGSYLLYEVVHRDLHVRAPLGAYGRWARAHHMLHHHVDPTMNHGVTSPLWDWVFGTLRVDPVVRVARSKAPPWMLVDGHDGAWRVDYELRGGTPGAG